MSLKLIEMLCTLLKKIRTHFDGGQHGGARNRAAQALPCVSGIIARGSLQTASHTSVHLTHISFKKRRGLLSSSGLERKHLWVLVYKLLQETFLIKFIRRKCLHSVLTGCLLAAQPNQRSTETHSCPSADQGKICDLEQQ